MVRLFVAVAIAAQGCATIDTPQPGGEFILERRSSSENRTRGNPRLSASISENNLRVQVSRADTCVTTQTEEGYITRRVAHQLTQESIATGRTFSFGSLIVGAIVGVIGLVLIKGAPAMDGMPAIAPNPTLGLELFGAGVGIAAVGYLPIALRSESWVSESREPHSNALPSRSTPCAGNSVGRTPVTLALGRLQFEDTTTPEGLLSLDLAAPRFRQGVLTGRNLVVSTPGAEPATIALGGLLANAARRAFDESESIGTVASWEQYLEAYPRPESLASIARQRVASLISLRVRADAAWHIADTAHTADAFAEFIRQFPRDPRAAEAQTRLDAIRATAVARPPTAITTTAPPLLVEPDLYGDASLEGVSPSSPPALNGGNQSASGGVEGRFRLLGRNEAAIQHFIMTETGPFVDAAQCRFGAVRALANHDPAIDLAANASCAEAVRRLRLMGAATPETQEALRYSESMLRTLRHRIRHSTDDQAAVTRTPRHPRNPGPVEQTPPVDPDRLLDEARQLVDRCGMAADAAQRQAIAAEGLERVNRAIAAGADTNEASAVQRRLRRCSAQNQ